MKRSPFVLGVIALVLGRAAGAAYAAEISFPARPVRRISPNLPVGLTNILSRLIAAELSESWGQQVVVENCPPVDGAAQADGSRGPYARPVQGRIASS